MMQFILITLFKKSTESLTRDKCSEPLLRNYFLNEANKTKFFERGDYLGSKNKNRFIYHICGTTFVKRAYEFLSNPSFPNCTKRKPSSGGKTRSTVRFIEQVIKLVENEYTVLGEYLKDKDHIEMLHNSCGYRFMVAPSHFLSGTCCPSCGGTLKLTDATFKQRNAQMLGTDYVVILPYINSKTKVEVRHMICNYM